MQFDLSPALIDEILFYMEDQSDEFFLDTEKGIITGHNFAEISGDRFIPLPRWKPHDGFRLMGRFAAGLHNPLVREELSAALNCDHGVFRAFKDTLSRYPETGKLWFTHKNRVMKQAVLLWYNSLRETWGMEHLGAEPEDISCLARDDFIFRKAEESDTAAINELYRFGLNELNNAYKTIVFCMIENEGDFSSATGFVAETTEGEIAGFIGAAEIAKTCLCIRALVVKPEYRGLGLGKSLVACLLEQADHSHLSTVIIDLPAEQEQFARSLLREHFTPCMQRFCRNIEDARN